MPASNPQRDAAPLIYTGVAPAQQSARTHRIVFRWVVFPIYAMAVFPLGIALFALLDGNSIMDGRLLIAVHLGLWVGAAMLLAGDIDRCWGYTRVEHLLTSGVCIEIGLGMLDCLAHLVRVLPLPLVDQVAPPLAALNSSSGSEILIYAAPIVALVVIQRRRAHAGWLD